MDAAGRIHHLSVPLGVYPPKEDTSLLASVIHRAGHGRGRLAFDIGCGTGALMLQLGMEGWDVEGCDVNPMAVAVARGHLRESGLPGRVHEADVFEGMDDRLNAAALVVWNTPYLPQIEHEQDHLGPLEEAALSDPQPGGSALTLLKHLHGRNWGHDHQRLLLLVAEDELLVLRRWATTAGWSLKVVGGQRFDEGVNIVVVDLDRGLDVEVEHVATTGSTNADLLARDAPFGARRSADHQQQGRGRRSARWIGQPGDVACSWVVHAGRGQPPSGLLQGVCGLASLEALQDLLADGARSLLLKWPNDLLLNGPTGCTKVGGWLVEGRHRGDHHHVVAGLGLNLTRGPDVVDGTPRGHIVGLNRDDVIEAIHVRLLARLMDLEHDYGRAAIVDSLVAAWHRSASLLEMMHDDGQPMVPVGVDDDGRLLLQDRRAPLDDLERVRWGAWP